MNKVKGRDKFQGGMYELNDAEYDNYLESNAKIKDLEAKLKEAEAKIESLSRKTLKLSFEKGLVCGTYKRLTRMDYDFKSMKNKTEKAVNDILAEPPEKPKPKVSE